MLIPLPHSPASSKRQVNFLVAGVQKAGTSSLHAALSGHPEVEMARQKEVHFFDKRSPTGIPGIDDWLYHRAFDWTRRSPATLFGEATPSYIWWPGALNRIRSYNPDIKLIICLRDPVERAWSQHCMDVELGRKPPNFDTALQNELASDPAVPDRVQSMLSRGLYFDQITNLERLFHAEQILILRFEDMVHDWPTTQHKLCRFLGLRWGKMPDIAVSNQTEDKPDMPETVRQALSDFFSQDAAATRRYLGWSQGRWSV